ncbi:hypothetical protein HU200_044322 [Digitaria exilis]|uniref:Uncharacterized protein n=1 Tax=Digitaria exilis TaxID=1010633 RepID=A0A835AZB5_9POAL|nr:hypothetical protein HU200_044322 [Digitaria exilis]
MDSVDSEIEESEWPPLIYNLYVFSSRTGQWEERSFAREGEAIGTIADMRKCWASDQRNAVYWRGILYVHCQADFVMRISLASDKYHVIKPPMGVENLTETGCKMDWVLKIDKDLGKCLLKHKLEHPRPRANHDPKIRGPWTLQGINYYAYDEYDEDDNTEEPLEEELEWSSQASADEKSAWSTDDVSFNGEYCSGYMNILGFHPFKEILFLGESITRGLAYHYNSSMVEVLGNIYPAAYDDALPNEQFIESSFPYTPCWLGQTKDENS